MSCRLRTRVSAAPRAPRARRRLHFTVREPRRAPRQTVVLAHALGCDLSMWDALSNALAQEHRVIAYDQRGHGGSARPAGRYTLAQLADDRERLLTECDAGAVVWIGLSMGGIVGQELALRHPARVKALVIANSTGQYPEAGRALLQQRIDAVQRGGLEAIAEAVMGRHFSEEFRAQHASTVARFRRRLLATDAGGYVGCCHAVMSVDTLGRLAPLRALLIAGQLDQGTPVAMSQALAERRRASLIVIPGATHLSATEQPAAFEQHVRAFIAEVP